MRRAILLLAVAALIGGCARGPETPTKLFAQNCSGCHGPHGEGAPAGKALVDNPFVENASDDALLAFIKQGRKVNDPMNTTHMQMPPKGGNPGLTDIQIREIISHIRELQKAHQKTR
ncbi:MAG: c-type cytochrome [Candidatus Xenobia bacterium]